MKLQSFAGGLATRKEPQLINVDQGVVYENIDNASAVLRPVKDKTATEIDVLEYNKFFVADNEFVSRSTPSDFLEFQDVMYISDRSSRPIKRKNGVERFLGITAPSTKPTTANTSVAEPLEEITAINNTASGDLPASDLQYLLVNVKDGIYSTPLEIVVKGSNTDLTRAVSQTNSAWTNIIALLPEFGSQYEGVTTLSNPPNRSVNFSDIRGEFADSAILFRRYNGIWRKIKEFATQGDTFLDDTEDISANDELDTDLITAFSGTYQYVYTYYNSTDGAESAPSPLSDELAAKSGKISVTGLINSSDPQVTNKRLYRVGQNITEFTLVVELDNVVTSFEDTLRDSQLEGTLLESDNYSEAPAGLQFLAESYAVLFGALGSTLRFTPIGVPNAWPPEFSIDFNAPITGIGTVANGVLVFTATSTFIVTGTGPTTFAQQSLRGDQGCISHDSIQEAAEGTLIWVSDDGLCSSSGNNVVSLTKDRLGDITLDPVSSTVLKEVYYVVESNGNILAWDYRFGSMPKNLNLGISTISQANNLLYGWSNGTLFTLFTSDDNLTLKFTSARFIEGSYTQNKTYKKVYIRCEGEVQLKILINDILVATRILQGIDTFDPQVPQDTQRGYSIQFEIETDGVVQEIEYAVGRGEK